MNVFSLQRFALLFFVHGDGCYFVTVAFINHSSCHFTFCMHAFELIFLFVHFLHYNLFRDGSK